MPKDQGGGKLAAALLGEDVIEEEEAPSPCQGLRGKGGWGPTRGIHHWDGRRYEQLQAQKNPSTPEWLAFTKE